MQYALWYYDCDSSIKRASSEPRSKALIMAVSKILVIDLPDILANIDCFKM